ncbi:MULTISPECIES: hypothetical protein [Leptospira]|nr:MULTISPECIES: hypothetical protein [Leptospira]EMK06223.1 hypothetical protein LEP1GSC166_1051 [Leptospira kirschneri]
MKKLSRLAKEEEADEWQGTDLYSKTLEYKEFMFHKTVAEYV